MILTVFKYFSLLLMFLTTIGGSLAQGLSISGKVVNEKKESLPYATLTISKLKPTGEVKANVFSNENGVYLINKLTKGKYLLSASFLGYQQKVSDTIELTGEIELTKYDFVLEASFNKLDEVTVTARPPVVEVASGKLVFNLQNSTVTSGQTALEMLKRIPGISVDQSDNIIFKGSSGVNVMIDGKMTFLSGSQLATYLQGLNAEDISKIELITAPPAELDAAGNTGIINIVRKRKARIGYAVDLRSVTSKAKYWMFNENISASLTTSKLDLYGSFDFNTPHRYSFNKGENTVFDGESSYTLRRSGEAIYKINYYTWRVGADWQLSPSHKIGFSYHGYLDDFKSDKNYVVGTYDDSGKMQSLIGSTNNIIEPYHFDALNLHYEIDLDSAGKKISVDGFYTSYRNYSDASMVTDKHNSEGHFIRSNSLISHQPGFVKIKSIKADAELPLEVVLMKTGIKFSEVENDNQYRFDSLQSGILTEIPEMSNHFKYKEQIGAIYFSASKKINKTSINTGLRLEHTNAEGLTFKQDISNHWEYTQLFPSLSIEQEFDSDNKVDFSISRRINRPTYTNLNPVRWYNDPYFYYSGNPNVVPELAWIYSLNYSFKSKYIFSLTLNQSNNYISRKLAYDENSVTIKSLSANFGKMKRVNFTTSFPVRLFSWWNIQFFSDASYTTYPISVIDGERQLSLGALGLTVQQELSLPQGVKASINTYYYLPELRGIYKTYSSYFTDIGINKSFLNKNLRIQFTVSDVFDTNRYKASSQTDIIDYYYNEKPFSRKISLSISYHVGGKSLKPSNRKAEEQDRL